MTEAYSGMLSITEPLVQRRRDYALQRNMSLADLLLENRIIFLQGAIDAGTANSIVAQLLYLQFENKAQEIHLYINCPGGSVSSTLAIYDTMQFLECPICTYCMGLAASGAAIILAAGTKGKRYALPNSKVMMHQPWGQVPYAQVSDIEITANEFLKDRQRLNEILAKHTGKPYEIIEKETERDRYFHAQEAKEWGIVDDVLQKLESIKKT